MTTPLERLRAGLDRAAGPATVVDTADLKLALEALDAFYADAADSDNASIIALNNALTALTQDTPT